MKQPSIIRIALIGSVAFLGFCGVPSKSAILKALEKSDPKGAVKAARDHRRSSDFLARELLVRAAGKADVERTLHCLINGSGREMMPVLERLGKDAPEVIRAAALSKMHLFGKRGALDALEPYLDSDLGLARAAAVRAFLKEDQKKGFYKEFIIDPEREVRLGIILSLDASGEQWAGELLYEAARHDPAPVVKRTAVRFLDPRNERHLELLKEIVAEDKDQALTISALSALARDALTSELPWMQKFITSPVSAEGIYYAASLLKHKRVAETAARYLEEALSCTSPTLRRKLLSALLIQSASIKNIERLASDASPEVRLAWSMYARKMDLLPEKRIEILGELAGSRDETGLRALISLAEERSAWSGEFRDKLWGVFKKGDKKEKIYLLTFLGRSVHDAPLALEAMASDDPEIRLHGAAAYLRH